MAKSTRDNSSVSPVFANVVDIPEAVSRPAKLLPWLKRTYRQKLKKYYVIRKIVLFVKSVETFIYYIDVNDLFRRQKKYNYPLAPWSEAGVFKKIHSREEVRVAKPELFGQPSSEKSKSLHTVNYNYVFPEVQIHQWTDATVFGASSMVFSQGRCYYNNLLNWDDDYTSEELHGRFRLRKKINAMRKIIPEGLQTLPEAITLLDACASNYSHWLTEILPRLALLCEEEGLRHVPILLDKGIHKNILTSVGVIAGLDRHIYRLPAHHGMRVKKLFALSSVGYVPFYPRHKTNETRNEGYFLPRALQAVRAKVLSQISSVDNGLCVFVKRQSDYRRLKNAEAVESFFCQQGFKIINPIEYSFLEQAQLFNQAQVIVSETGAAMANIIFCRPQARVYIFMPDNNQTLFYYWQSMAQAVGGRVRYLLCRSVDCDAHSDYTLVGEDWKAEFTNNI